MFSIELMVISTNFIIISGAYLFLFPKIAQDNIQKLMGYDFLTSLLSLLLIGSIFWETEQVFSFVGTDMNWFWFTITTYLIFEVPFSLWYIKKYNINMGQNNE